MTAPVTRADVAPSEPVRRHGRARRRSGGVGPWLWVHLGTLVAAVPVLAWINRDQWFAGDEWQIITTNGLGSNPARASVFAPHFEHWATLGILVYKALYGVFALRSYVPYLAVFFAVILAVAHLSWRLLLRIGVVPAYATAVAALTMVMARRMGEPVDRVADGGHRPGGAGLRRAARHARARSAGATGLRSSSCCSCVALMCSGTGVTMTVVVALAALLRRGWRVTLGIVAVPAAVYALWYALEGASGQRNDTALSTALGDLPGSCGAASPVRSVI